MGLSRAVGVIAERGVGVGMNVIAELLRTVGA